MVTAAQAKKYGWNEKEKAILKTLNADSISDVYYELERLITQDPDKSEKEINNLIDELIGQYNLKYRVTYGDLLFEKLKFPFQFEGDYAGYSTLEELKTLLAGYEAKGFTHIESEELCLTKVDEMSEHEIFLLKNALRKYLDYHLEDFKKYGDKQKRVQLANRKKLLAEKKKEVASLEKLIANG